MTSLYKTLNADSRSSTPEEADYPDQALPEENKHNVGWLRWCWSHIEFFIVQNVPADLSVCEFECRRSDCARFGCRSPQKWLANQREGRHTEEYHIE